MAQVTPCPRCGRPNGPKYTRCMYCGADLPEREAASGEEATERGPDAPAAPSTAMDPKLLASLPPKLRAQILAETEPAGAAATAGTQPPSPSVERPPPSAPSFATPSSPGSDPTDIVDRESLDEMVTGEYEELDATITGEHAEVDALLSGEHPVVTSGSGEYAHVDEDDVQTDRYRAVTPAGPPPALRRGRGPFGPRDATARVLLLPDESYRTNMPWLRARLNNLLGLDAYTANLYLQREFPVFLREFDELAPAWALEDDLIAGGMGVLVLTREMVEGFREPFPAERVEIDERAVVFEAEGRPPVQVDRADLLLAILGEVKPLGEPGGPLIERTFWRVKSRPARSFSEIQHPFWLLDLVVAEPGLPVRIRQDRFDFGCLGADRKPSTLLNLKNLPARLAAPGRELPVDDLFRRVPRVRREQAQAGEGAEVAPLPEEEILFNEYTLIRALARRAGRGGSAGES